MPDSSLNTRCQGERIISPLSCQTSCALACPRGLRASGSLFRGGRCLHRRAEGEGLAGISGEGGGQGEKDGRRGFGGLGKEVKGFGGGGWGLWRFEEVNGGKK